MMMFSELNELPQGILDVDALRLHELMPAPTLVHLPGLNPKPIVVSVLLHGNEDVGLHAIQQLLRDLNVQTLPRALSIFFGNVEAARYGVRFLAKQPDFNRIWSEEGHAVHAPYRAMAGSVLRAMTRRPPLLAIDLHNNTGRNPMYSCIRPGDVLSRKLASLFSHTAIHTDGILGTLSSALAAHCPSITCECGEIGNAEGIQRATALLKHCLTLSDEDLASVDDAGLEVYESFATVKVPDSLSISWGHDHQADVHISPEIDLLNFRELPSGYGLAKTGPHFTGSGLMAFDEHGVRMDNVFIQQDNEVRLALPAIPAMLTPHEDAIRKTCLGYLMRRVPARPTPAPDST